MIAGRCNRQARAEFSATLHSGDDWDSKFKTVAVDFLGSRTRGVGTATITYVLVRLSL
jgi:hypothetical protein